MQLLINSIFFSSFGAKNVALTGVFSIFGVVFLQKKVPFAKCKTCVGLYSYRTTSLRSSLIMQDFKFEILKLEDGRMNFRV